MVHVRTSLGSGAETVWGESWGGTLHSRTATPLAPFHGSGDICPRFPEPRCQSIEPRELTRIRESPGLGIRYQLRASATLEITVRALLPNVQVHPRTTPSIRRGPAIHNFIRQKTSFAVMVAVCFPPRREPRQSKNLPVIRYAGG